MRIIEINRKLKNCPCCGAELYDILYGEPTPTWEEDYFKETGRKAVIGGCVHDVNSPHYECKNCRNQFRLLKFPKASKRIAFQALLDADFEIFEDVEFDGLYHGKLVYLPLCKKDVCYDGFVVVFVSQSGRIQIRQGMVAYRIYQNVLKFKSSVLSLNKETFFEIAKRIVTEHEYFCTVRFVGYYKDKRAYQPILKKEFRNDSPVTGLKPIILVDKNGKAEYITDIISFDIYRELKRKK